MSLEPPIKDRLRDPADEATVMRVWGQIDGRAPVARRQRRRGALGVLGLAACAGVALFAFVRRDAGPLRFADGRALAAVETSAPSVVPLSDGSRLELGDGARFEPLESTGTTFIGVLARGRATFEVKPGGPRRWQIECGLATVEVVGTRFSCDRAPGRLRVEVTRGAVLVRGERVPDRARRLAAGESLDVVEAPASTASAPALAPAPPPEPAPAPTTEWRELAKRGRNAEAWTALGAQGVRRETQRSGVADLLELADVARLSGHPRDAVAPLERVLARFPRDPQAPLAAFALARLELDTLDRPRDAAVALERALALGTPQSLREDALVRLADAHDRAGDHEAATHAARTYLREFPYGHARAEMEKRLGSRPVH
ncbi:MAG TPA: FecR domain-containing protein [Polyangia bacterium]|nr:FecR domain-containing protein [Polyangia bacterium]